MRAKALIIGNANYSIKPLDNAINDADDIAEILTRLGFDTKKIIDATAVQQDKEITDFAKSLDEYEIGLFYFAGHGFQIDNENYLGAVDTDFQDEGHAKYSSFPLNMLLSYFDKANNQTNIIILDACREILDKKSWVRSVKNEGLAPIFAPKGTLIAYATSPGQTAYDGTGNRNGVYTNALLQNITVENIPIEEMFKRVRNSVFAFSKGKQTSWEHTSLTGTFYFNSGQLAHSLDIEYSDEAINDNLYVINTKTIVDSIIKDLKNYNWYVQNPAIDKVHLIDASKEDKNKLFLLGRNILQSACGSSASAIDFMEDLSNSISQFNFENKNHVLNGIIYETFFNSYGSYRQDKLKDCYIYKIYSLLENENYEQSSKFLSQILMPYKDLIFYIPSLHKNGISIDLQFSKNKENNKLELKSMTYEGNEILIKKEEDAIWGISDELTYKNIEYQNIRKLISLELKVPENKLTLNSNMKIIPERVVNYPNNHRIMK